MRHDRHDEDEADTPLEIGLIGDLSDTEADVTEKLLGIAAGGECTLYIDSPGGSPYSGIALATLIRLRRLQATAVVTGECSSAALWPFAACQKRLVTPFSVLLFHPLKWQSDEHVGIAEAREWARHFDELEGKMDGMLARMLGVAEEQIRAWMNPGRYLTGSELAEAGLAELIDL